MSSPPEEHKESWPYRYLAEVYEKLRKRFLALQEQLPACSKINVCLEQRINDQAAIIEALQAEVHRLSASANGELIESLLATQTTLQTDLAAIEDDKAMLQSQNASLREGLAALKQENMSKANVYLKETLEHSYNGDNMPSQWFLNLDNEQLRNLATELEKKFNISEEKLEKCREEHKQMTVELKDAKEYKQRTESRNITLAREKANLKKERDMGCEKKCEGLERRLCRLVKALDLHGTAVNNVAIEVSRGLEWKNVDEVTTDAEQECRC